MIIGSHPEKDDDRNGEAFSGITGQYLVEDVFPYVGLESEEVYFTYAVKCMPKVKKNGTLDSVSAVSVDRCRDALVAEIKKVKPKVIFSLGDAACASLLQSYIEKSDEDAKKIAGASKWRGKKVWSREFECWIFFEISVVKLLSMDKGRGSTYHEELFQNTLEEAVQHISRKPYKQKKVVSRVITRVSEALDFLKTEIMPSSYHGFDIETGGSGHDFNDRYIIGASFSASTKLGAYFSWDLVKSSTELYNLVKSLLTDRNRLTIIHNVGFEYKVLKISEGIEIRNYFCTMISAGLYDENFYKGLKPLAWLHTDFGGYETELERYKVNHKVKDDYSEIPFDTLAPYGGYDSIVPVILYKKFVKASKELGYSTLQNKILFPVRRVMSEAEITGFKLDKQRALQLKEVAGKASHILQEKIYEYVGREFNIGSNKQLSQILYKEMKLKPLIKTKTGYSVNKDSIKFICTQEEGKEIGSLLSGYNYLSTMVDSHVNQALNYVWADGRVHTTFNMTAAVTGRSSASRPSLQNVPSDGLVKSMYTASDGCYLLDSDLKAAEYVYLAAASGERAFIEAFRQGYDVHAMTASMIFGIPIERVDPERRRIAKSINFGLVYGMTIIGLVVRLGITEEEAEAFIDLYFEKLPRIQQYLEVVEKLIVAKGWVQSLFGRIRRIPNGMSDVWFEVSRAKRQARNSPVQGGAADYAYLGLVRAANNLRKVKLRTKLIHTVHDCGIADSPENEVEQATELIRKGFEEPVKVLPVKMRVDCEVTKRWGENNKSHLKEIFEVCGVWEADKWL
jgi:uracil-DNA glycosylase family 4